MTSRGFLVLPNSTPQCDNLCIATLHRVSKTKGDAMQSLERFPVTVGIRLTEAQANQLRERAAADDRRPSAFARRLIMDGLARFDAERQGQE